MLQEKSFQKRLMKKRINISLMKQSTKDSSMKVKHAVSALYQLALENDAIHDVLTSFETIHEQLTENVISYLDAPTVDIQQKFDVVTEMNLDMYTKGFFHTLIKRREVYE